jgi:Ion channel
MITRLLIASGLVAITVIIHAGGLGMVLSHVLRSSARPDTRFWPITWLLIRIAWLLIVIHLLEIAVWALFFWWQKCLPDLESSFYFSGVTYATIGYGDLVLPEEWRLFGPLEGLTGILMCGLSTAFFFVVVSRRILQRMDANEPGLSA